MSRGESMVLQKPVVLIIGIIVLFVVIFVLWGGLGRIQLIVDQIQGKNLEKNEGGVGDLGVCPKVYFDYVEQIGDVFNESAPGGPSPLSKNSRCLIPIEKPPNLGDYEVSFDAIPEKGMVIGAALKGNRPTEKCTYNYHLLTNVIEDIYPCVVGTLEGDRYDTFKDNWLKNKPTIDENEFFVDSVRLGGVLKMRSSKGEKNMEDDLDGFYLYKGEKDGKSFLCFIQDEDDEQWILTQRIPLCTDASGPDIGNRQSYTCMIETKNKLPVYFNQDEFYCFDKSPDRIEVCRPGNDWDEVDRVGSCSGDKLPFNSENNCCCRTDGNDKHCVRIDFPAGEKTDSCSSFGNDWKEQACPYDQIRNRIGYVP